MGAIHEEKAYAFLVRESANDGSDFTNPDADYRVLFLGEDGALHLRDSAGAVTAIGTGGSAGPIEQMKVARVQSGTVVNPENASETAVPSLPTLTVTLTATRSIRVTYSGDIVKGSDGDKVKYYVYRDGVKVTGNPASGWYSQSVGESSRQQVHFTFVEEGLVAGTYGYSIRTAASLGVSSTTYGEQVFTVEVINETA